MGKTAGAVTATGGGVSLKQTLSPKAYADAH